VSLGRAVMSDIILVILCGVFLEYWGGPGHGKPLGKIKNTSLTLYSVLYCSWLFLFVIFYKRTLIVLLINSALWGDYVVGFFAPRGFIYHGAASLSGPGRPHYRRWSHPDTPHSEFLWTSDRPVAEASTWQHPSLTTDIHASGGIRTRSPNKQAAANPSLRPRGH
jgi:hypothetical protein